MNNQELVTILMADDDLDDQELTNDAWLEAKVGNPLRFVNDGMELMAYLRRQGQFSDPASSPRPGLILLDLNMPKKDGREAIREIKSDRRLRQIPIIILTTSQAEEDIIRGYDLGVNSFITKPVTFGALVKVVSALQLYWFQIAQLPPNADRPG